jgi:hypothetical protein
MEISLLDKSWLQVILAGTFLRVEPEFFYALIFWGFVQFIFLVLWQLISMFDTLFAVEKRCSQCSARDVAHLQTHQAREEGKPRPGTHTSAQVPVSHLCVSILNYSSIQSKQCSSIYPLKFLCSPNLHTVQAGSSSMRSL